MRTARLILEYPLYSLVVVTTDSLTGWISAVLHLLDGEVEDGRESAALLLFTSEAAVRIYSAAVGSIELRTIALPDQAALYVCLQAAQAQGARHVLVDPPSDYSKSRVQALRIGRLIRALVDADDEA